MVTKKTYPYEYGTFSPKQIDMIDSGAVINRPGRLDFQHTVLLFDRGTGKDGKSYLSVNSYDTLMNRPKSEIKTAEDLKKYLKSVSVKFVTFKGYVKKPEDMSKLMHGDRWVGYFTFNGDPLSKAETPKKTVSHVLGHNRTVIAKKPRKYTPAYNYRENQWRQSPTPNHDIVKDSKRAAKEPGWRPVFDKNGNVDHYYFERRANRSDTQKQRRTALGLRAKESRYSRRGQKVVIDRQKPKVTLIIPDVPGPAGTGKVGKYYSPNPKKPLTEAQLKAIIKKAELTIHEKPIENCYVFDETKGVVFTNTGKENKVYPGKLVGKQYITTHNHPNKYGIPNTLSGADIAVLLVHDFKEQRACCYGYVYRIRPGTADRYNWKYYKKVYDTKITKKYRAVEKEYPDFEYYENESDSERSKRIEQYSKEFEKKFQGEWEKVTEEFCKKYGFWFKKERI